MPFQDKKMKFIFVMVVYPMIFTVMQYWITDNFLKYSENEVIEEKNLNEQQINQNGEPKNVNENIDEELKILVDSHNVKTQYC